MIDIDPVDAAVQYLKADTDLDSLVDGQIAAKHRYGEGWERDTNGLAVHLDGGLPELYVPMQKVRLEMRCYGPTTVEATKIWRQLVEMSRNDERVEITMANGDRALGYHFLQDSGPSLLYDRDLDMDFMMAFFQLTMCELKLV